MPELQSELQFLSFINYCTCGLWGMLCVVCCVSCSLQMNFLLRTIKYLPTYLNLLFTQTTDSTKINFSVTVDILMLNTVKVPVSVEKQINPLLILCEWVNEEDIGLLKYLNVNICKFVWLRRWNCWCWSWKVSRFPWWQCWMFLFPCIVECSCDTEMWFMFEAQISFYISTLKVSLHLFLGEH